MNYRGAELRKRGQPQPSPPNKERVAPNYFGPLFLLGFDMTFTVAGLGPLVSRYWFSPFASQNSSNIVPLLMLFPCAVRGNGSRGKRQSQGGVGCVHGSRFGGCAGRTSKETAQYMKPLHLWPFFIFW